MNEQWEQLTSLLPPQNRIRGGPPMTIAPSATASCGFAALVPLGAIFRNARAPGVLWPAASTAGAKRVFSSRSWTSCSSRPMPTASSTGPATLSLASSSERTSMRLGPKRGRSERSVRVQPGRLQHHNPSTRRGSRSAHDLSLAPWAVPRGRRRCAPQAAERGETPRTRAPQATPDPAY